LGLAVSGHVSFAHLFRDQQGFFRIPACLVAVGVPRGLLAGRQLHDSKAAQQQ
jgi:hypothetical protein